ncbi:MAG: cell division protein FtsQ [Candidatus Goldbacteria bacterium]|nr:cell division protein FtsQ [Candidatus Goldiibacteriota bacterium]
MQNYKFNFVKRKTTKFEFVPRYSKLNNIMVVSRNLFYLARSLFLSLIVLFIFLFSLNLIFKYLLSNVNIKIERFSFEIPFLKTEKFLIIKDNLYIVFNNGKKELVETNIDSKVLPVLTGIELNEKRPKHKNAFLQALRIKNKYLSKISEVNLKDPENIVLITVDGKKIYMGNTITNEKMKNLYFVLDRIDRQYTYMDLRYKNRVIIK